MAALTDGGDRKAKTLFEREVARAPDNDEFHFWLAIACLRLGEKTEARQQLALALDTSTTEERRGLYSSKLAQLMSARPPEPGAGLTAALVTTLGGGTAGFDVTEHDTRLVQVVRGHFNRHLVALQDADVVLLHPARRIGDELVAIFEVDAETQFRQNFGYEALHFNQFFFSHVFSLGKRCVNSRLGPGSEQKTLRMPVVPCKTVEGRSASLHAPLRVGRVDEEEKKARVAGFVSMYANASIAALPCYLHGEEPWTPVLSAQCLQCVNRPTYLELQPGSARCAKRHYTCRSALPLRGWRSSLNFTNRT
jgi:hypothetical protein